MEIDYLDLLLIWPWNPYKTIGQKTPDVSKYIRAPEELVSS